MKPNSLVDTKQGALFINPVEFVTRISEIPVRDRLVGALALAGCESWDDHGRYIKDSSVAFVHINGTVPQSNEDIRRAQEQSRDTMELSSAFSYLNSGNLEHGELYDKVTGLGHFSVAHTVNVGLIVAGATTAVENEFNSQRDLVHMSRLTVARTSIQSKPPIVVRNEHFLAPTMSVVEATDRILEDTTFDGGSSVDRLDHFESRNALYPASKATLFMLNGSIRNMQKLVGQKDDAGKESEYRSILDKIQLELSVFWPELFKTHERS